jgi:hypothetical protein
MSVSISEFGGQTPNESPLCSAAAFDATGRPFRNVPAESPSIVFLQEANQQYLTVASGRSVFGASARCHGPSPVKFVLSSCGPKPFPFEHLQKFHEKCNDLASFCLPKGSRERFRNCSFAVLFGDRLSRHQAYFEIDHRPWRHGAIPSPGTTHA